MVKNGDLSAGHARTLLGLNDEGAIVPMAKMCIEMDLSVRRLEEEVKKENKKEYTEGESDAGTKAPLVDYIREMELRIQSHLGRVAKIHGKGKKKSLTLYYEDNEDLDELLRTVCGKDFFDEI